jgi:small-conductance mechanosensitive channel
VNALAEALRHCDPIFSGAGLPIGLGLLLVLLALLPRDERHLARAPALGLFGFLLLAGFDAWTPQGFSGHRFARLFALFLLLSSMGRSTFLLFANGLWVRRWARPLPKILRDVVQALVFVAVGLLVLRASGVEPGSILTTSALLTAVIGLSLQDTLGNLFAGLAIQAQRPFEVGDWIRFDGRDEAVGRVTEINWRATRLLTLSQVEITVPNGAAAKSHVVNYSKPSPLVRQELQVVTPYELSPDRVRHILLHALRHTPDVLEQPEAFVVCRDYNDRGVVYEVRYFIDRFERHELIESEVRERFWYALSREGYSIPLPGRRVELTRGVQRKDRSTSAEFRHGLLSHLDLFRGVGEQDLLRLAEQCRHQFYAQEELIVQQGDASSDMYVIERGRVRIETRVPGVSPRLISVLKRDDFFGEISLLTGEPRTANVIAEAETEVIVLSRESLAPTIETHPAMAEKISRVLTERRQRLREAQGVPESPTTSPVNGDDDELLGKIRRFFRLG